MQQQEGEDEERGLLQLPPGLIHSPAACAAATPLEPAPAVGNALLGWPCMRTGLPFPVASVGTLDMSEGSGKVTKFPRDPIPGVL
eukprot:1484182-Heterocapsa_arctica.AAC.1